MRKFALSRKLLKIAPVLVVEAGQDKSKVFYAGNPAQYEILNENLFERECDAVVELRNEIDARILELRSLKEKLEEY